MITGELPNQHRSRRRNFVGQIELPDNSTLTSAPRAARSCRGASTSRGCAGRRPYVFSARRTRATGMRQAVSPTRQRLECGDLSPLFSTSASQAAWDSTVPRAKAPASWRTANASARHRRRRSRPGVRAKSNAKQIPARPRRPEFYPLMNTNRRQTWSGVLREFTRIAFFPDAARRRRKRRTNSDGTLCADLTINHAP